MKPMNERYKILFESVEIGPKVAKNRFYQVPHAMGAGNDMPNTRAAQRGIKAEGGQQQICKLMEGNSFLARGYMRF